MKLLFLYLSMTLLSFPSSSFYDLRIDSLEGLTVHASTFKGKKVLVAIVSASEASTSLLTYLDSAQKAKADLQVIAIPTDEFSGNVNIKDLRTLKKNTSIIITKPVKVRKENNPIQHPLLAWLTQTTENGHFNQDVTAEGQMFVVSPKGTLVGVLHKNTPHKLIDRILNQPTNE